jgi:hypothetical protein
MPLWWVCNGWEDDMLVVSGPTWQTKESSNCCKNVTNVVCHLRFWLLIITFSTSLWDLSWPIGFDHISPTSNLVLPSAKTYLVFLFELWGFCRTLWCYNPAQWSHKLYMCRWPSEENWGWGWKELQQSRKLNLHGCPIRLGMAWIYSRWWGGRVYKAKVREGEAYLSRPFG